MTNFDLVKQVRAEFPTPLYPSQSAAFLVALCQRLNAAGGSWGLRRKDAGMHTTLPDGTHVALDVVMLPDGQGVDVLGDSDGAATPSWNPFADPLPADWYVPVTTGQGTGPARPQPHDHADIQAKIAAIEAAASALGAKVAALEARNAALEARIAALHASALASGDTVTLETAHGRVVRAMDEQGGFILNQQVKPGAAWEQFVVRKR